MIGDPKVETILPHNFIELILVATLEKRVFLEREYVFIDEPLRVLREADLVQIVWTYPSGYVKTASSSSGLLR